MPPSESMNWIILNVFEAQEPRALAIPAAAFFAGFLIGYALLISQVFRLRCA